MEPLERDETAEAPGPRGIWSGAISFGLVSIPIEIHPALRTSSPGLRMLDSDGTPLRRRFFCPREEKEVSRGELMHGRELPDGRTVVVSDEELERVEPKKSREIDLRRFVPRAELEPLYFERPYFLVAAEGSSKAYRLLAAVLEKTGRAGIATFVMREQEYWVAIFAEHGILCAEILRFAEEVRAPTALPKAARAHERGHSSAWQRVIEQLSKPELDPAELTDPDADALRALAEKKARQHEGVVTHETESPAEEGGEVIDLARLLKKRLEAGAKGRPRGRARR
jgi:DNA end-binding protein Ku